MTRRSAAQRRCHGKGGTQFDVARGTMAREAMARGVDPSSGNFAAAQGAFGVREAAAKASAGNTARMNLETIGAARKQYAANLGRNLASNQATSAGLALNAGNNSSANGQTPLAAIQSGATLMNQGFSGAQQGLSGAQAGFGGAARTYGNITDTMMKAGDNSAMVGTLGNLAGTAAKLYMSSDVTMKKDIEPVNPDAALDAVNKTPVSNWAYKEGSKGDDGGETHTGPMAQDVQKNMSEKTAPKGKKIDLISLNGINMTAIQGLTQRINKVASAAGIQV